MKIVYSKAFLKNYKSRIQPNNKLKDRFQARVRLFEKDRTHPLLKDHKLKGMLLSFRAFSITGDVRVVYRREGQNLVIFIDVGTHSQVY